MTRCLYALRAAVLPAIVALTPPVTADDITPACEAVGDFTPVCGFQRPEDIEVMTPGDWLLVSEYGGIRGEMPGRLSQYIPAAGKRRVLYPVAHNSADGSADWGAPECPGPPGAMIDPHGIHHGPAGGEERLLVVNHGGREAIELFELQDAATPDRARLVWRGCVPAPAGIWLNDVVGLPDGGFAASHMVAPDATEEALVAAEVQRADTGWVMRWQPAGGWQRVPGSAGGLPNGLEISDAGDIIYVNEYFGDRVRAIRLNDGHELWSSEVSGPDNSSWTSDGALLVASHETDLAAVFACNAAPLAPCNLPYAIVALRADDGARVKLVTGGGANPMGAATVAVQLQDNLYIGSYVGDRLVRTPAPPITGFTTPPAADTP